jgi:hypothetical protein
MAACQVVHVANTTVRVFKQCSWGETLLSNQELLLNLKSTSNHENSGRRPIPEQMFSSFLAMQNLKPGSVAQRGLGGRKFKFIRVLCNGSASATEADDCVRRIV